MSAEDLRWMRTALDLARRRVGWVGSNPAVGAVLVGDGRVLGRGATAGGGRPHAEALALEQARSVWGAEAIRGATAYVTLEPCAHHGRTPPCAESLIKAGIVRVVCPLEDPDPRVAGRGFTMLRTAGLTVETELLTAEAEEVNAGYLTRQRTGRPRVTLKLATTLDGRIATRTGESRWITGPHSRRRVHLMRARADGVLIGAGTAQTDDPVLDVRLPGYWPQPVRIVADGGLSLPLDGRLAATATRTTPVWLLHRREMSKELNWEEQAGALRAAGIKPIATRSGENGSIDMKDALRRLGRSGLNHVLCEGGGKLAAALLRDRLVDEIVIFSAGKTIGGDGRPMIDALGIADLAEVHALTLTEIQPIGPDVMTRWRADA